MDLSIITEAFALRAAARALQRSALANDPSAAARGAITSELAPAQDPAWDQRALALMQRAVALKAEAVKVQQANGQPTGARATALLDAASAPLETGEGGGPAPGAGRRRGGKPKGPAPIPARKVRPMRRGK